MCIRSGDAPLSIPIPPARRRAIAAFVACVLALALPMGLIHAQGYLAKYDFGTTATEQEIAAVIVFLCSEPASNVAGAAWSVDGGAVPVII